MLNVFTKNSRWCTRHPARCHDAVLVQCLQIRRPNNYDINVSLMLGPTEPDPTMDVSSLDIVKTVVQDSPHKLFIGGLPCDWTEDQVRRVVPLSGGLCHAL